MTQVLAFSPQERAEPQPEGADVEKAIIRLLDGGDIDRTDAQALFSRIVEGSLGEPLMAAAFVALRVKGETGEELTGAAFALREAARFFPTPSYLFADSCGTGGDFSGSINVSTAAALVAAASGLPIVKHGNRSFTSKCGSADVLEALGARLDLSPLESREILDRTGFCFLLAPLYHPGIAHAGPVRRALKVRTIMNLLGPCLNPARPKVQLLGVADPKLLRPIAETLRALGVERALVVHGSGLDEIAIHGFTKAILLADGDFEEMEITPEQAGLRRLPLEGIVGGTPLENALRLTRVLSGRTHEADSSVVALNAGALLMTAGRADDLHTGVAMALDAMASGRAKNRLDQFIEASRG
ncbi:MAG TPA: anthranilate phosphoribosyltransferase [Sphingomicrobium sp.]|jgi:anthranilate phosphoribosyltransferase|nr:anthranilate phosphoribosyltransferase [Sphingomicrobium sp.]